jgi:hypothetical protein
MAIGIGLIVMLATVGSIQAASVDALKRQNPFFIVDQLTEFSYAQLHEMYPDLSDVLLTALMQHIVRHTQGLE